MTAECITPRAGEAGWTLAFCTCPRCKRRRTPYVIIKAEDASRITQPKETSMSVRFTLTANTPKEVLSEILALAKTEAKRYRDQNRTGYSKTSQQVIAARAHTLEEFARMLENTTIERKVKP